MSAELEDVSKTIISKINSGQLKMRPKIYFVIGSFLTFSGLVASILTSVFLFGLIRFILRTKSPWAEQHFARMVADFPWVISAIAILGLVAGFWLMNKYDFVHKFDRKSLIIVFTAAVILAGLLIDALGINDVFCRRGYLKKIYKQSGSHIIHQANM